MLSKVLIWRLSKRFHFKMEVLYSFRESKKFTQQLINLLSDEDYSAFQNKIIKSPQAGKVIKGSGGIRKIRWMAKGKGKSGGVRIIYYLAIQKDYIFMLDIYPKNEKEDLSPFELKTLKRLVAEWMENG